MYDFTWEHAVRRRSGLAAIAGLGSAEGSSDANGTERHHRIRIYEAGFQLRQYVVGSFDHGMQVGAEALYVHADGDKSREIYWSGFAVGPFVGYKKSFHAGLTFDVQFGAAYHLRPAGYRDFDGRDRALDPLLNLNLGWAF